MIKIVQYFIAKSRLNEEKILDEFKFEINELQKELREKEDTYEDSLMDERCQYQVSII
jgi:hypothetical protein